MKKVITILMTIMILAGTGRRMRLLRLPQKSSYLPIKDRKGWSYYVEEKGEE